MEWINGKYYHNSPVEKVLGVSQRKAGEFETTKVLAEAMMPEMQPMMPESHTMQMPMRSTNDAAPNIGETVPVHSAHGGMMKNKMPMMEKIPTKQAGK